VRWEEVGWPDRRQLDQFHADLPATIPLLPENMDNVPGCDGMEVYCLFRHPGGGIQTTKSWQSSEPATFELATAVHRLASEVLTGSRSREVLEGCRRFLDP